MDTDSRMHPGQLVILWVAGLGIEWLLFQILGAIEIPTKRVPGAVVPTAEEQMATPEGIGYLLVLGIMGVIPVLLLVKTWKWFGTSEEAA